jgi:hypothetical protein
MPDETKRRSSLRFSLRSLLQLTLVAAVAAFIAAPFLRTLSVEQWWRLAKTLGASAAGMTLWLAIAAWLRFRNDRRSGRPVLQISSIRRPSARIVSTIMVLLNAAMIAYFGFLAARIAPQPNDWLMRYLCPLMWGMLFAQGWTVHGGLNSMNARICENGIAWGIWFAPWRTICLLDWRPTSGELKLLLNRHFVSLVIAPADRARVEEVLAEHSGLMSVA